MVDHLEAIRALAGDRVRDPDLFQIVDDEWSLDVRRAMSVLEELDRRGLNFRLIFDSRATDFLQPTKDIPPEAFIKRLAPHAERYLVGAECGYDEGLAKIGKGTTTAGLEACARLVAKYGIESGADFSFILGLPWEDKGLVKKTVAFAGQLVLNYGVTVPLNWYRQIPGRDPPERNGLARPPGLVAGVGPEEARIYDPAGR